MRFSSLRSIFAFLIVGLIAGCSDNSNTPIASPDTGSSAKKPMNLIEMMVEANKPIDENPDVATHFGKQLHRDFRMSDSKPFIYLTIENRDLSARDLEMLNKSKAVQILNLTHAGNVTDAALKSISANQNLLGILLSSKIITDAGIKELTNCKNLDTVSLNGCEKVTDTGLKELGKLAKLEMLYLSFMTVDGSFLASFGDTNALRWLELTFIEGFTDKGAESLGKFANLDTLKIQLGFKEHVLTSNGIKSIIQKRVPRVFEFDKTLLDDELLPILVAKGWMYGPNPPDTPPEKQRPVDAKAVQLLYFDYSKLTDKGFESVLDCVNAVTISVVKTGITDATLKKLGEFKKLNTLTLSGTKVTGVGLEALAPLSIERLSLDDVELTEESLIAIGKIKSLRELRLQQGIFQPVKAKGDWLKHLDGLALKEIDASGMDFTEGSVAHLLKLRSLETLNVNNTSMGDAGFVELLKLPVLKSLSIDGTKVTKEAYLKAKKDYPKLNMQVYRFDHNE